MSVPNPAIQSADVESRVSEAAPETGAMADRAARGFALMIAQSLASRVVQLAVQVLLARLLAPEIFGLVALTSGVGTLVGVLQSIGVREALLSRQREFLTLIAPAFWMTAAAGALALAVIIAAAPLAAHMYKQPELMGLVLVLAFSAPLSSLSIVPEAVLQHELKFKFLAGVTGFASISTALLNAAFAALGFGAYSFVIPRVVVGAARLAILWHASGLRPGWHARIGEWRRLAGASGQMFIANVCSTLILVLDSAVLGLLMEPKDVGYYYFAYQLSVQTIVTFSVGLSAVMLPTLAKMTDDRDRMARAFLRTIRVLAAVLALICMLQVFAAHPGIHAVFGSRWDNAVLAFQILSVSMFFSGTYAPVTSVLQAQRRFGMIVALSLLNVALFFACVVIGGRLDGVRGVAVGVSFQMLVCSVLWAVVSMNTNRSHRRELILIPIQHIVLATVAAAAGYAAGELARTVPTPYTDWARLVVIGAVTTPVYAGLIRVFAPESWNNVAERLTPILRRVTK